jgi:hypothetical protein
LNRIGVLVLAVLALWGCAAPAAGDPATWLPPQLTSGVIDYTTRKAAGFETRPICGCQVVIERAGGDLSASTITQGGLPRGNLLVMVLRAPGVDPSRLLEAMITHGQLEPRSRTDVTIDGKPVTVLGLPAWASGPAYLTTSRDTLVLIQDASEQTAVEYIQALP